MLLDKKLREEVGSKYKLVTIRADKYDFPEFGTVDLRQINLKKADELFNKGFPFLVLREHELTPGVAKVINVATSDFTKTPTESTNVFELRSNKQFINKLLTLNWNDLSFNDKLVFNDSEKYFLDKKSLMLHNANIEKEMRSLHTKVKSIAPDNSFDSNRKDIMNGLAALDDAKAANWKKIDTWGEIIEVVSDNSETDSDKAVRVALEILKKVKANEIYIYRAIKSIPDMPRKTAKQRDKIIKKQEEVEKRKLELIELGHPYKS